MSTFDFTQARADAATYLLFDACAIVTVAGGTDVGGAPTETETSVSSPCAFDRVSGTEAEPDVVQERGSYRLRLPRTASISGTSRIIYGGKSYRVVWTPPLANIALTRMIGLEDA
jgi:hypothetical protein